MAVNWYSLKINHVYDVDVPESLLAGRMKHISAKVKGFQMLSKSRFTYDFFPLLENQTDQSVIKIPFTTGSIVPLGPNKCRIAINTDLKTLFAFLIFLGGSSYLFTNVARNFMDLEIVYWIFFLYLASYLILTKRKVSRLHDQILAYIRYLAEEYSFQKR